MFWCKRVARFCSYANLKQTTCPRHSYSSSRLYASSAGKRPSEKAKHEVWQSTWKVIRWLPVGIVFTKYGYTVMFIKGNSMQPTLNPEPLIWQDLVIFDRMSICLYGEYNRGDVVSLKSPSQPGRLLVKRIIALPGDIVRTLPPYPDPEVIIPEGHVWVEGDEAYRTYDSNTFGPIPLGLIDARLSFILWPLNHFGSIPSPPKLANRVSRTKGLPDDHPVWRSGDPEVVRQEIRKARVKILE